MKPQTPAPKHGWGAKRGVSSQEKKEPAIPVDRPLARLDGPGIPEGRDGSSSDLGFGGAMGRSWEEPEPTFLPLGQGQRQTAKLCMMALGDFREHFQFTS